MENIFKWGYCDPKLPIREDLNREIDVLYNLVNELPVGSRAFYAGSGKYGLTVDRVSQGVVLVITDSTINDLDQQEMLTAFQRGSYAGFGPSLLKSRYAVSNLLKRVLTDLPNLGIDIFKRPEYTYQQ